MEHIPVLAEELIEFIRPKSGGIYVDCTLGGGGHTLAILSVCGGCRVIAFEVDPEAVRIALEKLKDYERSVKILKRSYAELEEALEELGLNEVDGIVADLGISSFQVDDPERGFSFRYDSPLDMRMDPSSSLSAWNVVNEYPLEELERVIRDYGEERFYRSIAKSIVKSRPMNTTKELVEAIRRGIPAKARYSRRRHFATKTFQAIRIEVNKELENLKKLLEASEKVLKKGGRIAVISFHSLEDRIVKRFFKNSKILKEVTKKPIVPSEEEVSRNPRSRSAKMRIAERI